jgi:hypothetical protein
LQRFLAVKPGIGELFSPAGYVVLSHRRLLVYTIAAALGLGCGLDALVAKIGHEIVQLRHVKLTLLRLFAEGSYQACRNFSAALVTLR